MLSAALRTLFGRSPPRRSEHAVLAHGSETLDRHPAGEAAKADPEVRTAWPAARLALTNQLWGTGFIFPGGELETVRLARPLGSSSAATLLIVGVGSGGPASAIARNVGAWVTAMESDPSLLAAARGLITRAQLGKKVTIKAWDPEKPEFGTRNHHHCLALEPLRDAQPEPILDGLLRALRPGGQIVMTELGAPAPLNPNDPVVRRWAALEKRDAASVPAPVAVTRMLTRIGLDVRVAEDMSQRHLEQALLGWRVFLRDLDRKPNPQEAAHLVAEAELWLMRRRLIRDGKLKMMRWLAMSRVPIV